MKVFVTGHRGYIGVHATELLLEQGHEVVGCDLRLFEGCQWDELPLAHRELIKDVRDVSAEDLDGCDAILHLAAISNDPMGDLDPQLTYGINRDATVRLASLAKEVGVPRFIFFGSCSVYGKGEKLDLAEGDPVNPVTPYAKSKIDSELLLGQLADANFTPVYLRNATAYGFSKMLRIDLVVNNLLGSALSYNEIRIMSDGSPWRPLIHCRDIARAALAFMEAPREKVHNLAVNVGGNSSNYQIRDVGDQVQRLIPSAKIVYTGEVGADPRNYRVNFDLLGQVLPSFKLQYDLASGMEELHREMVNRKFNAADFEGDQFVRLRRLSKRMELVESRV